MLTVEWVLVRYSPGFPSIASVRAVAFYFFFLRRPSINNDQTIILISLTGSRNEHKVMITHCLFDQC